MSLHVTCLYWYDAELRKAQSLKAVLVGELCEAACEFFFPKRHSSSSAHYVSYPYSRMRDSSHVYST